MIKLGKLTDYAIVVLTQLSKDGGDVPRSAHYLAEKLLIPEPTVAKVLKQLAKQSLVDATRGAAGGYKSVKAATDISLAEIVTVMEGPVALVSCVPGGEEDCLISETCPVKGNWDPVNKAVIEALSKVSLAEIARPYCHQQEEEKIAHSR